MQNFYEQFGIAYDSDKTSIKKAYFMLIKKHSPEKDPYGFRKIRDIYEILSDSEKRLQYSKTLEMPEHYRDDLIHAHNLISRTKIPEAVAFLVALDKKYTGQIEIKKRLGEAYLDNGNFGKAVTLYEKLTANNPDDQTCANSLTNAYFQRGYTKKAEMQFKKAIVLDKHNTEAWRDYLIFCQHEKK